MRTWEMPHLCEEKRRQVSPTLQAWTVDGSRWSMTRYDKGFFLEGGQWNLKNSRVPVCRLCSQQVMSETVEILNLRYLGDVQVEVHFEKPVWQSPACRWKLKVWNVPWTLTGFSHHPTRVPLLCPSRTVIERVAVIVLCGFSLPGHSLLGEEREYCPNWTRQVGIGTRKVQLQSGWWL